ncbi:hypothetical protein C8J56DRAFT_1049336 [Mycena floridula]|nr:hypothetical protein C8J56DRAFT_1049336 [Mycena floridula]
MSGSEANFPKDDEMFAMKHHPLSVHIDKSPYIRTIILEVDRVSMAPEEHSSTVPAVSKVEDTLIICDRVQWFRAEADYERALEVWETRQAEFIRGIRYFKTLSTTWADIAKDSGEDAGKMAYAKQKSAMYARMHSDAEIAFTNLGYGSLMAEGCDLAAEIAKGRSDIVAALRRYDPDFELPKEIQDAPEISDSDES